MIDLLQRVLAAHGGLDRWNTFQKVSPTIVAGSELFAAKGINFRTAPRRVSAAIDYEWTTEAPYRNPDRRVTFVPERVVIESSNNSIVGERDNPRASFAGHKYETPWGTLSIAPIQRLRDVDLPQHAIPDGAARFCGRGNGDLERRRRNSPRVAGKSPAAIASHCPEQDFYFGPDLLLRRHDYQVDIAGSSIAQYAYDAAEFHGFRFPTKRRTHPRGGDGRPNRDRTSIGGFTLREYVS